mmetsp:Transcript_43912/g.133759  ORF Transcript_43912/g.133759 Transcript_43912/m.133759 type:complete len:151 (-) Transcript_43912:261-713(-)
MRAITLFATVCLCPVSVHAWAGLGSKGDTLSSSEGRRSFLGNSLMAGTALASMFCTPLTPAAAALDMEAFANRELASDSQTKKLSDDEALCKFGMPSRQTGDACVRAGMSTKRRDGGVDSYGNVDRGTFVRCKASYVDTGKEYKKVVTCE